MGFPHLISLPTELLHYLCLFLSEVDIISLSQTCLHLCQVLNDNTVWKRFVTEEVRSLKSQNQQVNPHFQPSASLCENRQHVLKKNRLLSNWRNGTFTLYETNHGIENMKFTFIHWYSAEVYNENYLIAKKLEVIQFWDIRRSPVLCHTMPGERHLIGDYLVVVGERCRVDVYKINIEEWTFPPLYSFAIVEDTIVSEIVAHDQNECCSRWNYGIAGNYLVFNQRSFEDRFPDIHIWDVVNAHKVGVFTSPVQCCYAEFRCIDNNCLFLTTQGREESVYLKFDLKTRTFSETVFMDRDIYNISYVMFHQNHCVIMKRNDTEDRMSLLCEVFEFNTSVKVKEQHFENAQYSLQQKHIVDGKLVILSSESFHVVDALTLDTVVVVKHGPDVHTIMCQTSVFGSIFLVTIESDGVVKIWDLENETSTLLPVENFSKSMVNHICYAFTNRCIVYGKEPLTKFVIFGKEKMYVTNFW